MNIWINIFLKLRYFRATMFGLTSWPFLWAIIGAVTTHGYWYLHPEFVASTFLYLPTTIELIGGRLRFLFTWIIIIGLVNTIWGVPTTPIVIIDNVVFRFNSFLLRFHSIRYPILLWIQLVLTSWQHICWVQQPFPLLWLLYLYQVIE
jgi:hypothetical protein